MSHVGELRDELDSPLFNQVLKKWVGAGSTDYEKYLRTEELLALQGEPHELAHPDELMFQVVHQAQELWLKLLTQELTGVVDELDRDALWEVVARLDRIARVVHCLHNEMAVLETMPPQAFLVMRHNLGEGSGQESPGYNAVLKAAEYVGAALCRLLERREVRLADVYGGSADLTAVCERLLDFDEGFQRWLIAHFMLVRRTIGVGRDTLSLDGMPARMLMGRMTRPLFRELWAVRDELTATWGAPVLRDEFPLLATCTYLNSNSTGAQPRGVKRVLDDYWATITSWRDSAWGGWLEQLAGYRDVLADFVGAPRGTIVTDVNTSTLLGRVGTCLDFGDRPRVVLSHLEFPSMPFLWRGFARYGAEVVTVGSGPDFDAEGLVAAIDERTRLVCVSHGSYTTGAVLDVGPIVARAREVGALVLLDAFQTVGVVPVDLVASGVDFAVGGAHKWLCGAHTAFLYVREDLLPELRPAATGWFASEAPLSWAPPTEWAPDAQRLASGMPVPLTAMMSRVGLDLLASVGVESIRAHSLRCTERIIQRADEAGLTVVTPRETRGGVVVLSFPGDQAVHTRLDATGMVCSYRGGLRIAPHVYNTLDEIDRFMDEVVA